MNRLFLTTDELIDRFAARWGADAQAMKSPPESHLNYPIAGADGGRLEDYNGEIQVIRLSFNGRWGTMFFSL